MRTDYITRKERMKSFAKAGHLLAEFEINNPHDNIIAAVNTLNCAFTNKQNAKTDAYKLDVKHAIELLQKEIH